MSLASVLDRVAAACRRVGRDPAEVTVVAVSKVQTKEAIAALYEAGHRDFGENRADELQAKAAELPDDIRWHFVGHLQSNKARIVRPIASVLHSLDRESLAYAWLKAPAPASGVSQVNIGQGPRNRVDPDDAVSAVAFSGLGIPIAGVMAILPIIEAEDAAYFRRMADVRDQVAEGRRRRQ